MTPRVEGPSLFRLVISMNRRRSPFKSGLSLPITVARAATSWLVLRPRPEPPGSGNRMWFRTGDFYGIRRYSAIAFVSMPYQFEMEIASQSISLLSFLSLFYVPVASKRGVGHLYQIDGFGSFLGMCLMLAGIAINFVRGVGYSYAEMLFHAGPPFTTAPPWSLPLASLALVTVGFIIVACSPGRTARAKTIRRHKTRRRSGKRLRTTRE